MFHAAIITYKGFWNYPSSCQILHGRYDGTVFFGLGHLRRGRTTPTNKFDELASRCHGEYYPKERPHGIRWFDIWPDGCYSLIGPRIQEVIMDWSKKTKSYSNPQWRGAENVPQEFIEAALQLKPSLEDMTPLAP